MTERVFLSAPHLTGREMGYIQQAFDDNWIGPLGPHVEAFEQQLIDIVGKKRALALSSGTAAIHLALRTMGIGRGDVVLASSFTAEELAEQAYGLYEQFRPAVSRGVGGACSFQAGR